MKAIKLSEVSAYNPPSHHGTVSLKLQGEAETGVTKFWQGLSYFLPNGGADWQYDEGMPAAEFEKTYFVVSGELVVIDGDEKEYVIKKGDSIAFLPNEGRRLENRTNETASALVTFSTC
ncbi:MULTISPECIES: cupin domain-containing protein [Vibrio]|uniref:Cupin type-2 domain-containing protein n=1 Tax=Vibrio halioticoli NBRC 102217 TaxID=1219072 RepID=V5F3N3_9VIBR|nr:MULTISPECIES: cupin domain-containing protein [Vibrio]GAD89789.1 hypothetical protein VHA01S_027_00460 [Vibrio halioticoli NBRC 102217]